MVYGPGQPSEAGAIPPPKGITRPRDVKRDGYLDAVAQLGLKWLESQSSNNVVTESEFSRYLPLFSKQAIERLGEDAVRKLSLEYSQRFSPHHPIKIVDPQTPDKEGVELPKSENGEKFRVIATIPARLNRLESVNVLGEKVVQVAAECMANTRSTSNPFDKKGGYYSSAMAKLVGLANQKSIAKQSTEFKKYESSLLNKGEAQSEVSGETKSPPSANPTGIEADWDE